MKTHHYLFGSLGIFVNAVTNGQVVGIKNSSPILHSKTNLPYTIKVGDYIVEVQENITNYFIVIKVSKKVSGVLINTIASVPEHRIPPAVRTYMLLATAGLTFN